MATTTKNKAKPEIKGHTNNSTANQPHLNQRGKIVQEFGTVRNLPLGLSSETRQDSVNALNQVLADTIMLASMYKKHHWQISGATFYQLHLLFDKHYEEQDALVDVIAERVQLLGGVSTGMPSAVAQTTILEDPPAGAEDVPTQISRLLEAHEAIMKETRDFAEKASDAGDAGTDDLLVSQVLRTNELQVWFLAAHLVDNPLVDAN